MPKQKPKRKNDKIAPKYEAKNVLVARSSMLVSTIFVSMPLCFWLMILPVNSNSRIDEGSPYGDVAIAIIVLVTMVSIVVVSRLMAHHLQYGVLKAAFITIFITVCISLSTGTLLLSPYLIGT